MLKKFDGGRSKRVYEIITGDESWFYYYDPRTKRQSPVWVARNDPSQTKVRRQRFVGKHVCNSLHESCFNAIIPIANGKTATAKCYAEEYLSNVLKQSENCRHLNDLIIHHDNASPHKATQTMEYLEAQRITLVGHPAYSPDLSPYDFGYFQKLKNSLVEKIFKTLMNFMLLSKNKWTVSKQMISTNAMNSGSKE